MTLKESFTILGLPNNADITSVKQAYRRLAFDMHPDLHPEVKDAAKNFQRLNEAYVVVTQHLDSVRHTKSTKSTDDATEKARQDAQRAYKRAKAEENSTRRNVYKEEVLNDILKDPFARRVFEDIYRHIQKEGEKTTVSESSSERVEKKSVHAPKRSSASGTNTSLTDSSSVVGKIKGWLRRQIDDEQELKLPKASLRPGAVVRLEIQHGIMGKPHTVEIVLPDGYKAGKSIRLKGLGKRVGNVSGDLYVRIIPV